ncbi:D-inositol-3-phosphate glycosyltransferase [Methylobacterium hispanicum]|jgi:glycosyltransferase involved in cell wall biosynthesis|uniref:D-inositol-3-phosphate glycosyltransferase n=1 Tax=Methylobacterium hispanicum TaxID=270350 RepID=A0AAV4ZRD0_9HYPH|nr:MULTISPECIES: glycosyltransferase [Methylobacterium]GJD90580.1 D-inositol-3-phosphate glycosyltransferase [Methylobacterium hispanicum]
MTDQTGAQPGLDIRHLVVEEAEQSRMNGVHLVANRLAREQIRLGQAVRVVVLHPPGRTVERGVWDAPVEALPLEGHSLFGHLVQPAPRLTAALVAGAGPRTLVHLHCARRPLLLAIGRELARRGIRYVVTIHGRYAHVADAQMRRAHRSTSLYLAMFERRILERAWFVHALTDQEAGAIRQIAPRARIEIVANAAYSSAFDAAPPPPGRTGPSPAFPLFGFCGRYAAHHKGLDLLIGGLATHLAAGGRGRLALAGNGATGGEGAALRALAQGAGIGGSVAVGGPVFGPEKERTLRGWDFFVQSSRFDGLPIGAVEAALCGLPLIVSTATGLADAVERHGAGFVVRDLTTNAVAEALGRAARLTPEAWARMSRAAHAMALVTGDWARSAEALQHLYATQGTDLRLAG